MLFETPSAQWTAPILHLEKYDVGRVTSGVTGGGLGWLPIRKRCWFAMIQGDEICLSPWCLMNFLTHSECQLGDARSMSLPQRQAPIKKRGEPVRFTGWTAAKIYTYIRWQRDCIHKGLLDPADAGGFAWELSGKCEETSKPSELPEDFIKWSKNTAHGAGFCNLPTPFSNHTKSSGNPPRCFPPNK